ncbi:MAG: exosortase A [Burkholderiaceae bacterium]
MPGTAAANARSPALVGAAVALVIVLVYGDTARSMVGLWRSSETYSHGFVVVPIALWLIWRRRSELAHLPVRPFWPALSLVAAAGFVWSLGRLAGANVVQHFALVLMIVGAVPAVLGTRLARAMAFPLLFLLFAVPFGEAFVPWLIDWTAHFTVAALKVTGVPVYREGNDFVIPTGRWSVVEACSGLRYLIASLMVGTLYAYLMYASAWRRAAFIAASVVVPLVANWLRAYLIVMLGHLSGNELAVGVDHLIYGWIFFGLVIALMFWVGTLFRDEARHVATSPRVPTWEPAASRAALLVSALAAVVVAGVWPPLAAALAGSGTWHPRPLPPIEGIAGWTPVPATEVEWQPRFTGHRASLRQTFERDGRRVTLYVAYYEGQTDGHEMVNSANVLVPAEDRGWRETARGRAALANGSGRIHARTATIVGPRAAYDVAWWYWIGGTTTASDGMAKALQAWSRLTLKQDASAAVFVFAEATERGDGGEVLRRFVADMGRSIERSLTAAAAAAGQRR